MPALSHKHTYTLTNQWLYMMATYSVVQYLASVHFITLIAGIEPSILRSEESDRTGGHLMCRDEVQIPVLGSLN